MIKYTVENQQKFSFLRISEEKNKNKTTKEQSNYTSLYTGTQSTPLEW